jgi:SPP1 gp7 family putative phage head morphogenesis protein
MFQVDPTRTLGIRNAFSADLGRRFRALKGAINRSLVDNDALGLKPPPRPVMLQEVSGLGVRQFAFETDAQKVVGFMDWLQDQVDAGILEIQEGQRIGDAIDTAWTNVYIERSYKQGIERARSEMIKAGYPVPPIEAIAGGVNAVFNAPVHADRVGVVYSRTFRDLKGITDAMDQQISQVLAQGIAEGKGPRAIAREINKRVDKIGITRSRTLARTEVVRAHHVATIQEYENAGVLGVTVKAEFTTAGDDRVCAQCAALAGRVFTLKEARGIIPVHPNDRCVMLPVDITDKTLTEARREARARGDQQRRDIARKRRAAARRRVA